jgi:hypothetical protein
MYDSQERGSRLEFEFWVTACSRALYQRGVDILFKNDGSLHVTCYGKLITLISSFVYTATEVFA